MVEIEGERKTLETLKFLLNIFLLKSLNEDNNFIEEINRYRCYLNEL